MLILKAYLLKYKNSIQLIMLLIKKIICVCARSEMDIMTAFEAVVGGSNPSERTKQTALFCGGIRRP